MWGVADLVVDEREPLLPPAAHTEPREDDEDPKADGNKENPQNNKNFIASSFDIFISMKFIGDFIRGRLTFSIRIFH